MVSAKFLLNRQTVISFWMCYVNERSLSKKDRNPKITEPDVRMIEFLKCQKPITAREIQDRLGRYFLVSGNVDVSTICRTLTKNLNFMFKRLHQPSWDRKHTIYTGILELLSNKTFSSNKIHG